MWEPKMTKLALILGMLLLSTNLFAASNKVQKVNNDIIAIDGQYAQQTMTRGERLKALRSKLEKRTEEVVQKKIEELRFQQELELTKKIQQAFNQQMKALDNAFEEDEEVSNL